MSQSKNVKPVIFSIIFGLLIFSCSEEKQTPNEPDTTSGPPTPQQAAAEMLRGINMGNTLEPDEEGGWNNGPAQEYYFDDYKDAGFACVRIPVKWGSHTSATPPFTIDPVWLFRVEQVIDWGLERGLYIILNAHHEGWLKDDYSDFNKARFDSIWTQIAQRFKNRSEKLLFEIINEPYGLTLEQINDLNLRILPIIRQTNPTRIVIFSGHEWSNLNTMMDAAIPEDDYLMAYWHSYDPWRFGGEAEGTWGSPNDYASIAAMFEQAADWAAANDIPVMISEFGAVHACDYNSRMFHYYTFVEQSVKHKIVFQAWDDGGNFGIYNREARTWPEVKDILLYTYPEGPTLLNVDMLDESSIHLSWQNRTTDNSSLVIERTVDNGLFEVIAQLDQAALEYLDANVSEGHSYTYRVIAEMDNSNDYYSYPIRIATAGGTSTRSPFNGSPAIIPGTIQAEDFDYGGEGIAYHDSESANVSGAYRPLEGVDIEARDDGGFQIAYVESGEWLEYSIDVPSTRTYVITTYVASTTSGGSLSFNVGTLPTSTLQVTSTGSWDTLVPVSISMTIPAGEQILKLSIVSIPPFNIDRIVFN
ncbi:cellulase family glycosylhydrolase [bacterium]|nr:cellulase family glycosylhydrolase [bacterium]